ncbi:DUF1934 domain-containing protein [Evansella sp. AB-rgal1]|uniref:DUF1934 domain-containing protein n=1 Tax=Evansella sp. AB-rgal1 TaxID=3242696 RepID=UPI00359E8892
MVESTKGLPVSIHMKTTIRDGSQRETNTITADGQFYEKGDTTFIRFQEPPLETNTADNSDEPITMQTLKIQKDEMTVLRKGAISMSQRFLPGVTTEGVYQSSFGHMPMTTKTKEVTFQWNKIKREGSLVLRYSLHLQGAKAGEYDMRVTIKEVIQ